MNLNDAKRRLMEIDDVIKENESKKNRLEGELDSNLNQLKEKLGTDNIRKARKILEEKEVELKQIEEEIQSAMEEIEKMVG